MKKQRSLTYAATLPDRECPIKQLGGCQFPTQTISMMQRYKQ
nr:MAG TPA: hypothetical protein [Caudoviricetes sp.]